MAIKQGSAVPSGFDVVVTSVIGRVDFSDVGSNGPVEEAFRIIGKHVEENEEQVAAEYRFPGERENESVVVSMEKERRQ